MSELSPLTIVTACRLELALTPVPMPVMPSSRSEHWLAFILPSSSQYWFELHPDVVERIQAYMIEHQTECLNDGWRNYTIYGRRLAGCNPKAVAERLSHE